MNQQQTYMRNNIAYWTKRAPGYSQANREELHTGQRQVWAHVLESRIQKQFGNQSPCEIPVLDVGTGPGFFAILLAGLGYPVTAVDYTRSMLEQARDNAGPLAGQIHFRQMNAQELSFPDEQFAVVVSRNVTWNLPSPRRAYEQWTRVLRPGGLILNFDANWYRYLYDLQAEKAHRADKEQVRAAGVADDTAGTDIAAMEALARQAPLSRQCRPPVGQGDSGRSWPGGDRGHGGVETGVDPGGMAQQCLHTPVSGGGGKACGGKEPAVKRYVLRRLLQLIPILFVITFLSFGMMRLAGSDAVLQKMENTGMVLSRQALDAARAELGLDKPFLTQYLVWLGNLLRGNMGTSYISGQEVFSTFLSKLPATLLLTAVSLLLTVVVSIPLGVLAAVRQNQLTDYGIRFASFLGNSMPNFFVAMLLMYLFAIRLDWLPVISREANLQSVILPAMTLAIAMSAKYLRQVRATVLEELGKDYVAGAKARGIRFSVTLTKSVLRACMVTILTLLTLSIGSLLGGTAIVESIFLWDGVGKLAVDAINLRDYPMIQAYVMWMIILYVCVNLITDLSYRMLDPRIRLEGAKP